MTMTFEQAKARAYGVAFGAFFRVMRRLVGETGIARLAGDSDDHFTLISVGDGKAFAVHVMVKCGPIFNASELDAIIDPPPTLDPTKN
jgi:hypothetical protein